jgi:hypothetical protein
MAAAITRICAWLPLAHFTFKTFGASAIATGAGNWHVLGTSSLDCAVEAAVGCIAGLELANYAFKAS